MSNSKTKGRVCYIYKLTSPSGNIYIGQTSNISRRLGHYRDLHCKAQRLLYDELVKYGWGSFKKEILFDGRATVDEICQLERDFIKNMATLDNTLNIKHSGHKANWEHPNCRRVLQIDRVTYEVINVWPSAIEAARGVGVSDMTIAVVARKKTYYSSGFLWCYEDQLDINHIKRVREAPHYALQPIVQFDLSGNVVKLWPSQTHVEKELGYSQGTLNQALWSDSKFAWGFLWMYQADYEKEGAPKYKPYRQPGSRILARDLSGNIVGEYERISDAQASLGIDKTTIMRHLRGDVSSPKKYFFEYLHRKTKKLKNKLNSEQ